MEPIGSKFSSTASGTKINPQKFNHHAPKKQLVSKRNIYSWAEDSHYALPAFVDANILTLNVDADFEVMKVVTFGFDFRDYATEVIESKINKKKLNMQDYAR